VGRGRLRRPRPVAQSPGPSPHGRRKRPLPSSQPPPPLRDHSASLLVSNNPPRERPLGRPPSFIKYSIPNHELYNPCLYNSHMIRIDISRKRQNSQQYRPDYISHNYFCYFFPVASSHPKLCGPGRSWLRHERPGPHNTYPAERPVAKPQSKRAN
jgi:hypothetical protein